MSRYEASDGSEVAQWGHYGKRVRHGEWILCDKADFLSVLRVCMHSLVRRIESVLTIYCLDVWTLFERFIRAIQSVPEIINAAKAQK